VVGAEIYRTGWVELRMKPNREVFPKELFVSPLKDKGGKPLWKWEEEPINKRLLNREAQESEALRKALSTDLTADFIKSLYHKVTRTPSENINIEVKGETRSGKSSVGIFLAKLISYWWGHEFTPESVLPNQGVLLERLKDAEYGETFLIDEQTPETYGEGILRETEQLGMCLNITAKQCNNLIFIYPPSFTSRNSPYGLETLAKDVHNKYIKLFYHDLRRKQFGFGGIWPQGFITLPKYQEEDYQVLPKSKWSKRRVSNQEQKGYDFDSLFEETYEAKKDEWVKAVRELDSSVRMKIKEDVSIKLADDEKFMSLKTFGQKEAYVLLQINRKNIQDFARSEIKTIVDMATVIAIE
jgi:hypothetical protein